jgi:hypothetical protein
MKKKYNYAIHYFLSATEVKCTFSIQFVLETIQYSALKATATWKYLLLYNSEYSQIQSTHSPCYCELMRFYCSVNKIMNYIRIFKITLGMEGNRKCLYFLKDKMDVDVKSNKIMCEQAKCVVYKDKCVIRKLFLVNWISLQNNSYRSHTTSANQKLILYVVGNDWEN